MKKIVVMGAGNWGSAIARLIANNLMSKKKLRDYDKIINLWLHEEIIDGEKLSDIINKEHVNVKYLPSVKLPSNVVAVPDLSTALKDVSVIVMVVPHEFYRRISNEISKYLTDKEKEDVIMVSLSKGLEFNEKEKILRRLTQVFKEETGLKEDNVAALSGPNIARDVARDVPVPTVIASASGKTQRLLYDIFDNENFRVELTDNIEAIEFAGALKNVVAVGAGIVEALGFDKKTFIEKGLEEMKKFASEFADDVSALEGPAGKGDLEVSCEKGRNRKFGLAIGKKWLEEGSFSIKELEKEALKGQKSQGIGTAREVFEVLEANNLLDKFPLFKLVYEILFEKKDLGKLHHFS